MKESVIPVMISGKCRNPFTSCFTYDFDVQASSIPMNMVPASQDFFFSAGTADFSGKLGRSGKSITVNGSLKVTDLDMTVGWTSEDGTLHQEKSYLIPYRVFNPIFGARNRFHFFLCKFYYIAKINYDLTSIINLWYV